MVNGSRFVHYGNGIYVIGLPNPNRIFVVYNEDKPPEEISSVVGAAIGYHAVNIRPTLRSFAGYDCFTYFHVKLPEDMVVFLRQEDEVIQKDDFCLCGDKLSKVSVLEVGELAGKNKIYFNVVKPSIFQLV